MPSVSLLLAFLAAAAGTLTADTNCRIGVSNRAVIKPEAEKILSIRGGGSKKSDVVLKLNAFVSAAYGIGFISAPSKVMAIYGSTETIAFMAPAHGLCQFMGGVHACIALRCVCALGVVAGLPSRDCKETLQDQFFLHAAMAAVAGYRTIRASQFSLLAATASPLPGSLALAALTYSAIPK